MIETESVRQSRAIYYASGIVSICGIIFEVLFGALGSYILGDGVKQYTLIISLFLTGMGIGAYISEKVTKHLVASFIWIEYGIGITGGFAAMLLFGVTAYLPDGTDSLFLYSVTLLVGTLTGVELPVLIRKANEIGVSLQKSAAKVLFFDYAGGLIGGLLFLFLLRPYFGLVKTSFLVGIINVAVALWIVFRFKGELKRFRMHASFGFLFLAILIAGALFGEEAAFHFEQRLYKDPVVFSEQTSYQQIILTKEQGDTRLYLDGQLQFSSFDEHRYHEILVHTPMAAAARHDRALVLGGGDGLAVRELLKYDELRKIDLVDLDPKMTALAQQNHLLTELNENSLDHEKVNVLNGDAFRFLEQAEGFYDVIIIDLPDPNNESLNKLYTQEFYSLARNHLSPDGAMMVQATSPVFAPEVYWTIDKTIDATGLQTENLHADIPSFGGWGYVLASRNGINIEELEILEDTQYLTEDLLPALTVFGKDEDAAIEDSNGQNITLEPNTLIRPELIEIYEKAWNNYD
ncbi:MAG: polyamine aminopropyltransferase [Planococcus sp. (in: firmicutes)]|uniref:polyamine aminopropyltransferase n=1 Tax=Planococcus alpniumensis TaxID=2708345 RepID=UPI001B8C2188|nr:polyamine aminopropyltransferase [Planococcus sp. MSAK28401]MDN5708775.1 polyamine aminopropyltransferase [Planococcus sp. (in: firmicutes)]